MSSAGTPPRSLSGHSAASSPTSSSSSAVHSSHQLDSVVGSWARCINHLVLTLYTQTYQDLLLQLYTLPPQSIKFFD